MNGFELEIQTSIMSTPVTKKLLNDPEICVQESLEGLVAAQPGLRMLQGHPVVIREDIGEVKANGKVTLLSGGGSGHEPSHAGFVGQGMLSAAVAGDVFSSPPPQRILAAIRAISQGNKAGTLLIVKNYTGDRLNFGIAAERAKSEGMKVAMVIVGEDCALLSPGKSVQRRGLCGTILIHKIAGAMAELGHSLEEIKTTAEQAIQSMGTMGVSLYPCSVPGAGPTFTLGPSEIEVGLGIHGEAGVKRQELSSANKLIPSLVKTVMASLGAGVESVVLVVNNLGGTSMLELTLVAKCAIDSLLESGVAVLRAYHGTFMTSLDMAGVSVTCLKTTPGSNLIKHLDAETTAPAWPRVCLSKSSGAERNDLPPLIQQEGKKTDVTGKDKPLPMDVQKSIMAAITGACKVLCEKEAELNELDSGCGDGDCGHTLKRWTEGVYEWLSSHDGSTRFSAHEIALHLAHISESRMGGSSGALYSIFFLAVATELNNSTSLADLTRALGAGNKAISTYGGASVGDRTMLDSLDAIHSALSKATSASTKETLENAAKAAEEAAERTSKMAAKVGRASYVRGDLTKDKKDAGATAVAYWMRGAASSYM